MYNALKERESIRVDEQDWIVLQAMNPRRLHNGVTFRNVLAHQINEVLTTYFTEIVAEIDQRSNLDLLADHCEEGMPLNSFWLSMFRQINIEFVSHGQRKLKITVVNDFQCKLPFSWIVKDGVDGQLANCSTGIIIISLRFIN